MFIGVLIAALGLATHRLEHLFVQRRAASITPPTKLQ
jgi:hypothetical protein